MGVQQVLMAIYSGRACRHPSTFSCEQWLSPLVQRSTQTQSPHAISSASLKQFGHYLIHRHVTVGRFWTNIDWWWEAKKCHDYHFYYSLFSFCKNRLTSWEEVNKIWKYCPTAWKARQIFSFPLQNVFGCLSKCLVGSVNLLSYATAVLALSPLGLLCAYTQSS